MEDLNKVILMGRLTRDVKVSYTASEQRLAIGRYTIAVNNARKGAEKEASFINCVAFGAQAEFAEKYFRKGMKVFVVGRIQTDSFVNKDGMTISKFDVLISEQGFAESKKPEKSNSDVQENTPSQAANSQMGGFMSIPDGMDAEMAWP